MNLLPGYSSTSHRVTVGASRRDRAELHCELHYPQHPARGRVFCIMGLLTDGAQWWPQIKSFTEHGYQVLTFDNRGCGRSTASSPPRYTTFQLAHDATELLAHFGWDPRQTHLAGVSMGGMICLELLTLQDFLSASLIVTTPTGPAHSPLSGGAPPLPFFVTMFRKLFDFTISAAEKQLLDLTLNFDREWLAAPSGHVHPKTGLMMSNQKRITRLSAKIWFSKQADGYSPTSGFNGTLGQLLAGATHHVSAERLERIRNSCASILVVGATRDKLVQSSAGSEALAEALAPQRYLVCDAGHAVNVQCAEEVNQAMLALFANAESNRRTVGLNSRL